MINYKNYIYIYILNFIFIIDVIKTSEVWSRPHNGSHVEVQY